MARFEHDDVYDIYLINNETEPMLEVGSVKASSIEEILDMFVIDPDSLEIRKESWGDGREDQNHLIQSARFLSNGKKIYVDNN